MFQNSISLEPDILVPTSPQSWYFICRSVDVPPGVVISRELLGKPIVIFRSKVRNQNIYALSAHCTHMGTHLGQGTVAGDHLRCPLHHWEYDGQGICRHIPQMSTLPEYARQIAYPVVEHYGAIFIFNGPEPLFSPPSFSTIPESELGLGHGRPVRLRSPWFALAANGFDMQHLQTVHARALHEPPSVRQLDQYRLQLRYVSRVIGHSAADRVMRWLSDDHIEVTITCWGGSVVTVESDLGRTQSALLLSLMPTESGTEVMPIVAVRKTKFLPLDAVRIVGARWLFSKFLQRDMIILEGIRFQPHITSLDESMRHYLEFLGNLPSA